MMETNISIFIYNLRKLRLSCRIAILPRRKCVKMLIRIYFNFLCNMHANSGIFYWQIQDLRTDKDSV